MTKKIMNVHMEEYISVDYAMWKSQFQNPRNKIWGKLNETC